MASGDEAVRERVMRRVLSAISAMDFNRPPPAMGAEIHRIVRRETGDPDPYAGAKSDLTRMALRLLPKLEERVGSSADPLDTALRISIAGNIMDFSITSSMREDAVLETLEDSLRKPFLRGGAGDLAGRLASAQSILFLADNAAEIVFDRPLLSMMPRGRVTVAVKGSPVINDATMEDAGAAGLASVARLIDNGSDVPGTLLESCSPRFRDEFSRAEIVVSKGQGNYETLSDAPREVFFLLRAKCATICEDLGCSMGDILVHRAVPAGSTR